MKKCDITLERRLTHKYRTGWDYLDDWQYIGGARILRAHKVPRPLYYGEDFEDGYRRTFTVRVESGASRRDVVRALEDTFTFGCQCEHDCCGHEFCRFVDVRHTKRKEYLVTQHVLFNI